MLFVSYTQAPLAPKVNKRFFCILLGGQGAEAKEEKERVSLGFRGNISKPANQPDKKRQLLPTRGQSPALSKKMGSSPESDQFSYSIASSDSRPGLAKKPAHSRGQRGCLLPKSALELKIHPA